MVSPGFHYFLQTHMWKTRENWQHNQFRLAPECFQPEPNLGIHYHSTTTMIYIYIYLTTIEKCNIVKNHHCTVFGYDDKQS